MPRYIVTKPGFFKGQLYEPHGRRPFLDVEVPFDPIDEPNKNPMPSWVKEMPPESVELRKARMEAEEAQRKLDEAKAQSDAAEIAAAQSETGDLGASFLGGDAGAGVETL